MNASRRLVMALLLGSVAVPAWAQPVPERIRGTLAAITGDVLDVTDRDGKDIKITLAPDAGFRSIAPTTLAAIKPGSAIGIVSRGPADHQTAVAIQIFAPGAPVRQGQFGWDMMPESTMTNAIVEGEGSVSPGGELTVKAGDKSYKMAVAPDAPVGQAGPGDKSLLKPGAKLVVFATREPAGLVGHVVIVGKDGFVPPL